MAKQMRAASFNEFGSSDKVQVETIDIPEVGEVLISVKAVA
ncbi:hypothetical protein [Pontibacter sp. Tf4]|nr:hypothetical protein [Pontibacter sp. Tf4]